MILNARESCQSYQSNFKIKIMRKLLFGLALLGCISIANAQGRRGMNHLKAQRQMMAELEPTERATLKTKKMTLALDLTAKQQRGVQALNEDEALWQEEMKQRRKEAREASEAKPTKEDRLKMRNLLLDQQIAYQQKLRDLLDEDQYQQWKKAKSRSHAGKKKMLKNGRSR